MANSHESAPKMASGAAQTYAFQEQNVSGNSRVHNGTVNNNGPVYNIISQDSTISKHSTDILKWLSPLGVSQMHERIRDQAHIENSNRLGSMKGSSVGNWFIESDTFDDWQSGAQKKLWCLGMPGAGKSVIASIVITHLLEYQPNFKQTRVAYLYLSYEKKHSIEELLGCIVKQLVEGDEELLQKVAVMWERSLSQGGAPVTVTALSKLLCDVVEQNRVYIIVDALDECASENRLKLMQCLQPESENLSILVTSRLLDEFKFISKEFKTFNIEAHPSDLDLFIEHEFTRDARLVTHAQSDPTLQEEVKKRVKDDCDGMFLVASLQMQALAKELTIGDVRDRLKVLPKKVDDMYELAMSRIKNLEEKQRNLALNTLGWIVNSTRPLTIDELRHALSTIPDTFSLNIDHNIIYEDDIRDFCGGLVTIKSRIVSLVHYTARSYFQSQFPGFHYTIAKICIAYLSLGVLEQPDDEQNQMSYVENVGLEFRSPQQLYRDYRTGGSHGSRQLSYEVKCEKFPLVEYAAFNLSYHLGELEMSPDTSNIVESLAKLLSTRPKRNFLIRVLQSTYDRLFPDKYGDEVDSDSDAWSSGSDDDMQYRLIHDFDSDTDSIIGSEVAGSITIKRSRLEKRFEERQLVESRSRAERSQSLQSQSNKARQITALHIAAFLGWPPLVTKLVESYEHLLDINCEDTGGKTPLIVAAGAKHWDVVSILVKNNADIDLMTTTGQDILQHAAESAKRDVVETLIAMALHSAAKDTRALSSAKPTAAIIVVANYYMMFIIQLLKSMLLLEFLTARRIQVYSTTISATNSTMSSDINSTTNSTTNFTTVTRFTLAPGKRPPSEQYQGNLQLLGAATMGDVEVIEKLFQENKINLISGIPVLETALFLAVRFNHAAVVEKLLESGGDINARGIKGWTLLHVATSLNDSEMVNLLLQKGAKINIRDDQGETAFSASLDKKHKDVILLLRSAGADPNTKGRYGVTRLYTVAAAGDIEEVRFLLNIGVNPSIRTNYGWAPLHWAAANKHLDCVQELISWQADLNTMSDVSTTPLDMAIKYDRDEIADTLRNAGALTAKEVLQNTDSWWHSESE